MDVEGVDAADLAPHLPDRLDEGLPLDVADGAADLDDDDIGGVPFRDESDAGFDLVRDVGDDLDRAAEIIAAPLLSDDGGIDLAGGDVGGAGEVLVGEALVVAEVEVRFGAVVGDEDLAMLVGRHRARVDVKVRVQLHDRDTGAAAFDQSPDRGGGDPFADGRNHAPRHEDVLRHPVPPALSAVGHQLSACRVKPRRRPSPSR